MRRAFLPSLALLMSSVALLPNDAHAQLAVMPRIGSTGIGADLAYEVSPWFVVRGGAAFVPFDPGFEVSDVDYEADLPTNASAALDIHLGGSGFRVSGGLFFLAEDLVLSAFGDGEVEIGDETFSFEDTGRLEATGDYRGAAPFLSIGFGRAGGPGTGVFLEIGAAFIGEPDVAITAENEGADAALRAALDRELISLDDDLEDVAVYPLLNLGVRLGL